MSPDTNCLESPTNSDSPRGRYGRDCQGFRRVPPCGLERGLPPWSTVGRIEEEQWLYWEIADVLRSKGTGLDCSCCPTSATRSHTGLCGTLHSHKKDVQGYRDNGTRTLLTGRRQIWHRPRVLLTPSCSSPSVPCPSFSPESHDNLVKGRRGTVHRSRDKEEEKTLHSVPGPLVSTGRQGSSRWRVTCTLSVVSSTGSVHGPDLLSPCTLYRKSSL